MKLLIVEDKKNICQTIAKHLKDEGYAVDACYDGSDASPISKARGMTPSFWISCCRRRRHHSVKTLRNRKLKTPVLLLTAKILHRGQGQRAGQRR